MYSHSICITVQVALQLSRDFVVYFEEYSICGGGVIDEFVLQHGVVELAHEHFHQDFCKGTVCIVIFFFYSSAMREN